MQKSEGPRTKPQGAILLRVWVKEGGSEKLQSQRQEENQNTEVSLSEVNKMLQGDRQCSTKLKGDKND